MLPTLFEALGPLRDADKLAADMRDAPVWDPNQRALSALERQDLAASLSQLLFIPQPAQVRLAENVQNLLRNVFRGRKPDNSGQLMARNHSAESFALLGLPRMGKTRSVDRAFSLFPQLVQSGENAKVEDRRPILWMCVSCPIGLTPASLCRTILEEFDRILGKSGKERYASQYGGPSASKESLPSVVGRLIGQHSVGCIILDDVDNVTLPCTGVNQNAGPIADAKAMLRMLLGFADKGPAIVLVGNMSAAHVIQESLAVAARGAGSASDVWSRLPQGPQWDSFLEDIWPFQWTRTETALTPALSAAFYHHSQGVIDLAIKLYQRVQIMLIREAHRQSGLARFKTCAPSQGEEITVDFVELIAQEFFQTVQPHLDVLRSNDPTRLYLFDDMRPIAAVATHPVVEPANDANPIDEEETIDTSETSKDSTTANKSVQDFQRTILLAAASLILSEREMDEATIKKIIEQNLDTVNDKVLDNRRKFFKNLEKRLAALDRSDPPFSGAKDDFSGTVHGAPRYKRGKVAA